MIRGWCKRDKSWQQSPGLPSPKIHPSQTSMDTFRSFGCKWATPGFWNIHQNHGHVPLTSIPARFPTSTVGPVGAACGTWNIPRKKPRQMEGTAPPHQNLPTATPRSLAPGQHKTVDTTVTSRQPLDDLLSFQCSCRVLIPSTRTSKNSIGISSCFSIWVSFAIANCPLFLCYASSNGLQLLDPHLENWLLKAIPQRCIRHAQYTVFLKLGKELL